jgi:HD-GYP domain-containing protein (c-di-GMP phosphodiesterase class II)
MTGLSERVPLSDVRDLLTVGQPLPFRVLDAQGRLLLNAGHVLADEAQFESLVERGAWAERPLVEAERVARTQARARQREAPELSLFDQWDRLLWQLDKLTRGLVRGQIQASGVTSFMGSLRSVVAADPDVALFLCVRQDDRRFALYPLTHSLHCAAVALLTGQRLEWPAERTDALACAALTMNLSILELQAAMAEQGEPPTAKQLREIRAHPGASVALLRAAGVEDETWLAAVTDHHERTGGGGYPRSLQSAGEHSQVLRAIDVFMAKISPRAGRAAMQPQAAVRQLFQEAAADPLLMALIKTLGVHPPGSLLQLRSGEVAVAIRRPPRGTQPLVATLSDARGRPTAETHRRDTAQPEFAVVGPLADTTHFARVQPERVYGVISGAGSLMAL